MFRYFATHLLRAITTVWCCCMTLLLVAVIAIASVATTSSASATVVRVDGMDGVSAPSGPNPGNSWANAYLYLRDGLARANAIATPSNPVQVWVRGDTLDNCPDLHKYYPDQNATFGAAGSDDPTWTFTMFPDVSMYGGFAGTETAFNDRDSETNVTVLSGAIDTSPVANSHHVVTAPPGASLSAIIDGFTIMHGDATEGQSSPVAASMHTTAVLAVVSR